MRVGIVCPYSLDLPGGVQGQVIGGARALAERGHQVMVLSPGTQPRDDLALAGIRVELLGKTVGVRANGSVAPVALSPRVLYTLRLRFADFRPDVVMIHEPFVPLASLGALLSGHAPRIGVFHRAGRSLALTGLRPLGALLSRRLVRAVVVSEEARVAAGSVVGSRADSYGLITNAIDPGRFAHGTPSACIPPAIVFVGRHEPRKGLEVLLGAVTSMAEELQLWVIGEGPETERLKGRYRDARISWLGRLSDEELAARLVAADIFVAPSLGGESFGVILLEAMAAKTPVICSDLKGYRLAAGSAAHFVPPGDRLALAAAMSTLLVNPEARQALVDLGVIRSGDCSFAGQADRYLALFSAVLADNSNERPTKSRG